MSHSLSLVVPVYNEEDNIDKLLLNVKDFFSSFEGEYEVIFVDDGSSDKSKEIIEDNKGKNMRLVSHDANLGYGEALKTGFEESELDLIGYIDGDNQFKVESLDKLLKFIDGCDMVIGKRDSRNDGLGRKIASRYFNYLVRTRLNVSFEDVNCGIKIFRRELYEEINLFTERTVDAELVAKAEKKGFNIRQVEVEHLAREEGESEAKGLFGVRKGLVKTTLKELDSIEEELVE